VTQRRLMTPDEMQIVKRMHCVTFQVASWDKRFFRSVSSGEMISEKEAAQLWRIFIRYRRQMNFPDKARLLQVAEKLSAPDLRKLEAARRDQARIDAAKAKINDCIQAATTEPKTEVL
jgi:hypothetical protein